MNYQSVMKGIISYKKVFEVSSHVITCMFYDKDTCRIFMTDLSGTIWIVCVKKVEKIINKASSNDFTGSSQSNS
jgi:hypothetical protein